MKFVSLLVVILWVLGFIALAGVLWFPEVKPLVYLLWAFPSGIAAGTAFAELVHGEN